jgi:hypothetical protein
VRVDESVHGLGCEHHAIADVHAAPLRDISHDVMGPIRRGGCRHRSAAGEVGELTGSGQVRIRRIDEDAEECRFDVGGGRDDNYDDVDRASVRTTTTTTTTTTEDESSSSMALFSTTYHAIRRR